jgi:hypothetical protein
MQPNERLHAMDAVRAFALLAGVALHASMAYLPGMPNLLLTPAPEHAKSAGLAVMFFAIHLFRMTTFFMIAGFFARQMLMSKGVKGFVKNRLVRILVPLMVGWPFVIGAIAGLWTWGALIAFHGVPPKAPVAAHPPLLAFPLTHLWFLYVLLELYLATLLLRGLVVMVDRKGRLRAAAGALFAGLVRSGLAPILFAVPVAALLFRAPDWTPWFGIPTPDSSLIASPATALAFFMAFSGGWLLNQRIELLRTLAARWLLNLVLAVGLGGAVLALSGLTPVQALAHPPAYPLLQALAYVGASWSAAFALIGLAARFLHRPSGATRYVADASYWIYVAHLPLVYALNIAVSGLSWSAEAKFALVVGVSVPLLLASYQLFVRYSFIGAVMNGRRKRPGKAPAKGAVAQPA